MGFDEKSKIFPRKPRPACSRNGETDLSVTVLCDAEIGHQHTYLSRRQQMGHTLTVAVRAEHSILRRRKGYG